MAPRLRFSLLNTLLFVAIAATGIVLFREHGRLRLAEAELARLRSETGYLSVDDSKQLHAIAVPHAGAFSWRWRIHLPGGHDYGIYAYKGKLTVKGLPDSNRLAMRDRIMSSLGKPPPRKSPTFEHPINT